jgi:hypothetical protein
LTAERPNTGTDCLTSALRNTYKARENLTTNLGTGRCSSGKGGTLKNFANAIASNNSRRGFNCHRCTYRAENGGKNYGSCNLSNFAQQLTKPAIRRKPCLRVYSRLAPHLAELFHFVLVDMDQLSVAIFVRHWRTFDSFSCSYEAAAFISTRLRRRDVNPIAFSTDSCKSCHA